MNDYKPTASQPQWGDTVHVAGQRAIVIEVPAGFPYNDYQDRKWRVAFPSGVTAWYSLGEFNDPNRDAPVEPTMHPDLEWLASLPPERFKVIRRSGKAREPYFYKCVRTHQGNPHVNVAEVRWDTCVGPRPPLTWTLSDIEQARKHLSKTENDRTEERRERMVLSKIVDDLVGEQIPDYETWFETHGGEITNHAVPNCNRPATVHELYTHFRARLLDELRQAGVIGEE